jgi:mannose-1-phosphate guanylyltransferase
LGSEGEEMKAIVLAAGEGRRLGNLTSNCPKCLLHINGRPILDYWLEACERNDISDVLINGHYLSDMLEDYLERVRNRFSMTIHYCYEEKLLGTGGTVWKNRRFVENEEFFLLCHGDNFTDMDIADFIRFHRQKQSHLTVALFEANNPQQCGIVEELDGNSRILRFVEKPARPTSSLANAAIFLMSPEIINDFPNKMIIDFSKEVLPLQQGKMFGYKIRGYNVDIGTIDNYRLANEIAAAEAKSSITRQVSGMRDRSPDHD